MLGHLREVSQWVGPRSILSISLTIILAITIHPQASRLGRPTRIEVPCSSNGLQVIQENILLIFLTEPKLQKSVMHKLNK